MRQKLQTLLFALVAIMMPIGASALTKPYTIGASGASTLYMPFDIGLPTGLQAFYVAGITVNDDGTVKLVEQEITGSIPACTAVILRGEPGVHALEVIGAADPVVSEEDNLLKGILIDKPLDCSKDTPYFALCAGSTGGNVWADWQAPTNEDGTSYTLGANSAYLELPEDLDPSKLKELPHLQHTHGGCEICGQVTGVEAAWGASADALTSYGTLDEAIAAAREEGSTVGYIQLKSDVTSESGYSVYGGTFTLDLNGKTLTSEGFTLTFDGGAVTITDGSENKTGKVITTAEGCATVDVNDGSTVSIDGGWYESVNQPAVDIGELANVTINGGEFYINDFNIELIDNSGTLTITGGTFHAENAYYAIYVGGNTTISDGTFVGAQMADVKYCGGTLTFEATEATDETPGFSPMGLSVDYQAEDGVVADIILPEGYGFYNSDDEAVTDFQYDYLYYIGKEEGVGYTVTFSANCDTEATMDDAIVTSPTGRYALPECDFNAPDGKMFDAWQVGDDEENLYQPGDVITITADTEVTAVWGDIKIVINMYDSEDDGWDGAYIEVLKDGEFIGRATLEDGDDGRATFDYDSNCTYSFIWHYGPDDFYPGEISFEISIGEEQLFTSEEGDCEEYADEQQIYPVPTSDELSIADDGSIEEFYYTKTIVGTLTYTRELPNLEWNSLYVPFEIEVTDELLENYEVAYANNLHAYDRDDNGAIDDLEMEIIKIKQGTLHANHPYFIRAKSEAAQEMKLVMQDVTLYNTVENSMTCQSFYTQFTLTGIYSRMEAADFTYIPGTHYAISTEGGWWQTEGLNPFRVYLTIVDRGESPVKIDEAAFSRVRIRAAGESATSIDEEQLTIDNKEAIYDLMGRRVMTPQKDAIYIVNGKKVVW